VNSLYVMTPFLAVYANDTTPFEPEIWTQEGLALLEENMVVAPLVHRDFKDEIAKFGTIVHTRRPNDFTPKRKTDALSVISQDAITTEIPVVLDQHIYVTFTLKDGEITRSFKDLVAEYLQPGMIANARMIDRALLGRAAHGFLTNRVGTLEGLTGANSRALMVEAGETMDINKAPNRGRNLIVSPKSQSALLENDLFISAEKRGDDGTALRDASIGRVLNWDVWMDQNVNFLSSTNAETIAGAMDAAEPIGETLMDLTITGYVANVGEFIVFADSADTTFVTAETDSGGNTTDVTINDPIRAAVTSASVVTLYKAADVVGAHVVGHTTHVSLDGYAANKGPQVGQLIAFGAGASRRTYTIVDVNTLTSTSNEVLLDRPLEVALANDDLAFPGPAGSLNIGFTRNALALINRPLALPEGGVAAAVTSFNDLSMRFAMQYDITAQGTIITLDLLAGTAILDTNQGVILQG